MPLTRWDTDASEARVVVTAGMQPPCCFPSCPCGVGTPLTLGAPSSLSPAASSRCRRAKRGQAGSPCGAWASPTATPWRWLSVAPRWVRGCHSHGDGAKGIVLGWGAALVSSSLSLPGGRSSHFSVEDLKSLGRLLCDTLLDFCDPAPAKVGSTWPRVSLVPRDHSDTVTLALFRSSSSAWRRQRRCCSGRWVVSQALEAAGVICPPQSLSPGISSHHSTSPRGATGAADGSFPLQHQWLRQLRVRWDPRCNPQPQLASESPCAPDFEVGGMQNQDGTR